MTSNASFTILYYLYIALSKTAIVWIPAVLALLAWKYWMEYITAAFIENIKWTMFEVRVPKDVFKTPAAMELFLVNALHQTGGVGTWYHRYWLGNVVLWSSLEIVSLGGELHFFIRTPEKLRRLVESQIYAQYPRAEIVPIETDYAELVPQFNKETKSSWSMWGCEFALTKADPYPIKTYVDYALDKPVDTEVQEAQIDPITPMLEFMGSIKKGEQIWFQILVRAHGGAIYSKKYIAEGHWFQRGKIDDVMNKEIQEILKKATAKGELDKKGKLTDLTKGQQEMIAAIERNMAKLQFDCGMRIIYIAPKENFDPNMIGGLTSVVKQYNSQNLNGFKPANATAVEIDLLNDLFGTKTAQKKTEMYNAYRSRGYFYRPFAHYQQGLKGVSREPFVLSSEELATIYHFPNRAVETPSFARIDSKKAEPPVNLPF